MLRWSKLQAVSRTLSSFVRCYISNAVSRGEMGSWEGREGREERGDSSDPATVTACLTTTVSRKSGRLQSWLTTAKFSILYKLRSWFVVKMLSSSSLCHLCASCQLSTVRNIFIVCCFYPYSPGHQVLCICIKTEEFSCLDQV